MARMDGSSIQQLHKSFSNLRALQNTLILKSSSICESLLLRSENANLLSENLKKKSGQYGLDYNLQLVRICILYNLQLI